MLPINYFSLDSDVEDPFAPSANFKLWKESLIQMRAYNVHMSFDELKEIERELAKSRSVILSALNAMAPLHQLPPELLTKIFFYVPAPSIGRDTVVWTPNIFRTEDIVKLSAICQHWRSIIFNAGMLWSSINHVATPPRVLQLARGVRLNCKLRFEPQDRDRMAFRRLLTSNIARIRELHVINPERLPVNFPLDSDLPAAPELEVLSIIGSSVAPQFFESPIPQLRTLFLCRSEGFPVGPLPQLTQLSLCSICKVEVSQVIDLLSSTPALQDLHISKSLKRSDDKDTISLIPLQHLRRVFIEDAGPHLITPLIVSITIQASTAVRIHYTIGAESVQMPTLRLSQTLLPVTAQISDFAIIRRESSLRLMAVNSISGVLWEFHAYDMHEPLPTSFVSEHIPGAHPREVTLVWVNGRPDLPRGLLRSLPDSVEMLSTSAIFLKDFEQELAVVDGAKRVPCPNLATLHVFINHDRRVGRDLALSKIAPTIIAFLERRAELGYPISNVVLGTYGNRDGEKLKLSGITALKRAVEHLDFISYYNIPFMKLPPICTSADGTWWTSWKSIHTRTRTCFELPPLWQQPKLQPTVVHVEPPPEPDTNSDATTESEHSDSD
ncbi:hypothetical protein OBBRIDRAFT_797304 [Obba rivulosa]|uniref:F-box domain-containing protein n=1 Tax=Obba rivulosa TaxID=1052685 RepID=A0A8E2DHZ3_9APHY|nr:hypothetical protein OBBRIDRAFT_797304 [Obba rivulosa]